MTAARMSTQGIIRTSPSRINPLNFGLEALTCLYVGWREGGMERRREEGRKGGREGGRKGGRKGGREGGRKGGREGGKEGRDGKRERILFFMYSEATL